MYFPQSCKTTRCRSSVPPSGVWKVDIRSHDTMDTIWTALGLEPTKDVSAIKRAYAEKAKTCRLPV